MLGYAFMGKAHANAYRTLAYSSEAGRREEVRYRV
jgi:hypothetical protein